MTLFRSRDLCAEGGEGPAAVCPCLAQVTNQKPVLTAAGQKVVGGHSVDPTQQGLGRSVLFRRGAVALDLMPDHLARIDHVLNVLADFGKSRLEIDECLLASRRARFRLRQGERAKAPLIAGHHVLR